MLEWLGLPAGASTDDVEATHDRLLGFLDTAPLVLQPWARRQVKAANAARTAILEPEARQADDDEALAESLEKGARAYVLKTVRGAEITDVVKAVAAGRVLLDERTVTRRRADHDDPTADLTPSERKVLELIGDGLSNREIGDKLGVAEKTVKNHITSLLSKMGLQRRTQVAAWVAGQRAAAWRN